MEKHNIISPLFLKKLVYLRDKRGEITGEMIIFDFEYKKC
jgi:hypothetical protein